MDTSALPRGFTVRAATPEDAGVVAELVMASDWRVAFEAETVEQDVREDWRTLHLPTDSWLAFSPEGRLVAASDIQDHGHVRIDAFTVVHPDFEGLGLGSAMLALTGARAEELADLAPPDAAVAVYRPTIATNEAAARLLGAHGYSEVRRFYTMQVTLDNGFTPETPDGIEIRTFVPGRDEKPFYEAQTKSFRDHWGDEEASFEEWTRHNLQRTDHDPSLWFIGEDSNTKEIAGVVISRSRSAENGWIDILGVRRPWRGRGLGEALLRTAFEEFRRRGRGSVSLGVDSRSPTGATRLYKRAGMEVREESVLYRKEVRAAKG